MANYDNLTVSCDCPDVINRLTAEKTGIDGLWFIKKYKSEKESDTCYLTVRNGINWLEGFKELSNSYSVAINVQVDFEDDWNLIKHQLLIENGEILLIGVEAGYMWEVNDLNLTDEQTSEIEAFFRKIDNLDAQEKEFVETQGRSEINYLNDYAITKNFVFGDQWFKVKKQHCVITIEITKQVISNELISSKSDIPF